MISSIDKHALQGMHIPKEVPYRLSLGDKFKNPASPELSRTRPSTSQVGHCSDSAHGTRVSRANSVEEG